MSKASTTPFTKDVVLAIGLLYAAAGIILFTQVGPWEAVRYVIINGLIVFAWLWSAERILCNTPIPDIEPIRRPAAELFCALAAIAIVIGIVAINYAGWGTIPSWIFYLVIYGSVFAIFFGLRYPIKELGITWPSKSGWWALFIAILVNFAATALFQIIPKGESPPISPGDLASQTTGFLSILALFVGLLFRAALPEELLFRITLQPRLARFLPVGWAILIQALLFSAAHLPQQLISYQRPFVLALGYLLTVDNGLIGGYLWYRTRSLPLLVILHLFAYPRFGI